MFLNVAINPERVSHAANPYRVQSLFEILIPGLSLLQPWAEISERLRRNFNPLKINLRRNFKLMHYQKCRDLRRGICSAKRCMALGKGQFITSCNRRGCYLT